MAETTTAVYQSIPLDQIRPSSHQARKAFDEEALIGLAESMKQEGLIEPIVVTGSILRFFFRSNVVA